MEDEKKILFEDEKFINYKLRNLGIIKIKKDVYEIVTDLPESSNFFIVLDQLEKDRNISAILFVNYKDVLGSEAYINYRNKARSLEREGKEWKGDNYPVHNRNRGRQIIIINRLILKMIHSSKIIICGLRGEVVSPFLGLSLASDVRLASENSQFVLTHSKIKLNPTGALPYFLPKYLGHAKAMQLLYYTDRLRPTAALELGLLSEILPDVHFEENCIEFIEQFISSKESVLKCTKKLMSYQFENIEQYLNIEECEYVRS